MGRGGLFGGAHSLQCGITLAFKTAPLNPQEENDP
jgi:hypothetical protein